MKDPAGQFNTNIIKEAIKVFGDIPASFETLIDLGTVYVNTHLIIVNSLDEDIIITTGDNEITIKALKDMWMDGLKYQNIVQYKYKNDAPGEGDIQIICY